MNGDRPDCAVCGMPREFSRHNAKAWEVWATLDAFGRDFDGMAGNPLPLRLEAVNAECARCEDPDGVRRRVLEIEKRVLAGRRAQAQAKSKK